MRFSSIVTSIREALQQRQTLGSVFFRGRTTNATLTELFIDGQPARRIVPSADSSVNIRMFGVAHLSNGTTLTTLSQHVFRVSPAGVITAVNAPGLELAGAAAAPSGAVVPKLGVMTLGGASGYTFTIVPATATNAAYIALSVTGIAATTIDWEFEMSYLEAGPRG
jgi:hypothetical protein